MEPAAVTQKHVECADCHDPHGVSLLGGGTSDCTHLINFNVRIVGPDPQTGRLEFRDLGRFRGKCTLICHGAVHRDKTCPDNQTADERAECEAGWYSRWCLALRRPP